MVVVPGVTPLPKVSTAPQESFLLDSRARMQTVFVRLLVVKGRWADLFVVDGTIDAG